MILESNEIVYSDGRHNGFARIAKWRGRYWIAFRSASRHASHDGRILMISSDDLKNWSNHIPLIDTPLDDRDPYLAVFRDRLFVASPSVRRRFEDEEHLDGKVHTEDLFTTLRATANGETWETPWEVKLARFHCIWWMESHHTFIYATEAKMRFVVEDGKQVTECQANFLRSPDGRSWERIGVISDKRLAHETAFTFLRDGRAVAFVRHEQDLHPQVMLAEPPYAKWENVLRIPFKCTAPGLGLVDDTLVIAGRVFLDDANTPMVSSNIPPRGWGLLAMTVDLDRRRLGPQILILQASSLSADAGYVAHKYPGFNVPDIGMPSILDMGNGRFLICYYKGYIGGPAHIWIAQVRLE